MKKNLLAITVTSIFASMLTTTISQASDIEIYQTAKQGDVTLMFMIDISGSMGSTDTGATGTRLVRVQNAMRDLLAGNTATGITPLDDNRVIGLATFDFNNGHVRIPARRLGDTVGNTTHRQLLLNFATNLPVNNGRTPTANAYADVAAYMMGTTTKGESQSGFDVSSVSGNNVVRDNNKYLQPSSLKQAEEVKECNGQGIYVLTDGEPNQSSITIASNLMKKALGASSFSCSSSVLNEVNNPTYGQAGAWSCIGNFAQKLLDPKTNPAGLKIRTAVIGFGSTFNGLPSYNKDLPLQTNLDNITNATINSTIAADIKNAAKWGIYGQGGWYSGNSSQDIVNSVNEFIDALKPPIPAVTTGTPTIPVDALNPTVIQNYAYFPQFEPTPGEKYQSWLGNIKKYNVASYGLRDKNNSRVTDNKGGIIANYDLWAYPISSIESVRDGDATTPGSTKFSLIGGALSQLLLKGLSTDDSKVQRKLLTNRTYPNGTLTVGTNLKQVTLSYLTDAGYKDDADRGYLMNLLGYDVSPTDYTKLKADSAFKTSKELRQIGAVMHSSPILITNSGEITYDETTGESGSTKREDYLLFGTTQGLLHVLDAETGKEKFAFVPDEMIKKQKLAFNKPDLTSGGLDKLYYGIDGPWTTHTEYVLKGSDELTVGTGIKNQTGKQIAYGGLRMGGRSYYALNLANINDPKLLFHIDPDNKKVHYNGSSKTVNELQYMGQSWSKPTIALVRWNGERRRVMFVGGGYDAGGVDGDAKDANGVKQAYAGYENDSYNQTNGRGGGIYMFDATTGDLLWWASSNATTTTAGNTTGVVGKKVDSLKYSVVSQIKTIDRDSDGLIDHLYFGDLGGQVFRIDLNNALKKNEKNLFSTREIRLLNLNKGADTNRFYETPAFSIYDYQGRSFAVISIGTGNRSKPLAEYAVGNAKDYDAIYNIYDKDVVHADLYKANMTLNHADRTNAGNHLTELTDANRFSNTTYLAPYSSSGWYYQFKSDTDNTKNKQTEKVFSTPIVLKSEMFVSTFDGSKAGIAGKCGAGVKGESFVTKFCMPYGQCASGNKDANRVNIGVGITGVTVGSGNGGDGSSGRSIIGQIDPNNPKPEIFKSSDTTEKLTVQRWYEKL